MTAQPSKYNYTQFMPVMQFLAARPLLEMEPLQKVEKWMENSTEYDSLLIIGSVGTGKSTIAQAMCRCWYDMLTTPKFCQCDIVAERIRQDETYKMELAFHKGLLVLDDLGTESQVFGQESMPFIIFRRYERKLPTIITSNLSLESIKARYGERIEDRLGSWGRLVLTYDSLRRRK